MNYYYYYSIYIYKYFLFLYIIFSRQYGPQRIEYADGSAIEFDWPMLNMVGYVYGQRISNYRGTITFRDIKNQLQFDF